MASGVSSLVLARGILITVALLVAEPKLSGMSHPHTPQRVGSSQARDQTHVSCIGRRILNCWTTRKVPGDETFEKWLGYESCTLTHGIAL